MTKLILLFCLVIIASSFQIFDFKIFQWNEQPVAPTSNLQADLEQLQLHADDDQIYMGSLITPDIQSKLKYFIEQAYIYYGNDQLTNIQFIQQRLNMLYNGTYVVAIYGGQSNYSMPMFGKNVGISSYSIKGNQWWIYWRGASRYQPYYAYYVSKQEGNITFCTCFTSSSYPYSNSSTSVLWDAVNAAEMDFTNIQNFTAQVQQSLTDYSPKKSPAVTAVNGSIPFYMCAWNAHDSSYIQRTSRFGFTVVSTPRI